MSCPKRYTWWQSQRLYWEGSAHLGREQEGKENQETCSAMWLTALGFLGIGFVLRVVSDQSF